jgi:integrase/recombinase XerD
MNTKIALHFDNRKVLTTGPDVGRCHIKLILSTYPNGSRIRRYFKTDVFATKEEYKKITSGNPGRNHDLQDKQTRLFDLLEKAKEIIRDNPYVDVDAFEAELYSTGSFKLPLSAMRSYADALEKEGRIKNAEFYRQAVSSFKSFAGEHFTFGSVTDKWLMRYERWMLEGSTEKDKERAKKSITTVGMYCRAMRTIFNLAIDKRKIRPEMYPFGKGRYVIPSSKGRKLALTEAQKNKVLAYRTLNPILRKAVDMWIFSYLCYGMNFADIARLRFGDIKGDTIVFDRTKTKNTERDRSFIEIPLRNEARAIMKLHGNWTSSMNPNAYIFPVLRDDLAPKQVNDRVHDFIRATNDALVDACAEMELPRMTTYWARHTFATIAYKKTKDMEFIQKALGHSDIKTTQVYINGFDTETKRQVSNWL